jgi:hypothetical protein
MEDFIWRERWARTEILLLWHRSLARRSSEGTSELGKTRTRRPVHIVTLDANREAKKWRRPLRRNEDADVLSHKPEENVKPPTQAKLDSGSSGARQQGQPATASSSRFHISARIIATGRSQAIPPGKLSFLPFTHSRSLTKVYRKADQPRHLYANAFSRVVLSRSSFPTLYRQDSMTDVLVV